MSAAGADVRAGVQSVRSAASQAVVAVDVRVPGGTAATAVLCCSS